MAFYIPGGGLFGSYGGMGDVGRNAYMNSTDPTIRNNPYLQGLYGPAVGGPSGPNIGPPQVPGQITGAPGYGGSAAAGSKPRVPRLGKSMQQAITQNLNNLPGMQNLAGQVNQFNLGQVLSQFEQGQPGYQAKVAQEAENVRAGLAGELSEGARRETLRDAAAWAAGIGGGGSGGDLARTLMGSRALESIAVQSLAEQQRAAENRRADLAAIPRAGIYDVEGKLITPLQQQAEVSRANYINAAPDPEEAFKRAQALANAGIGTGFGLGRYNAGGGGGGGYSTPSLSPFSLPTTGGIPTTPAPTPAPTPTPTPTGPGWGWSSSYIPGQGPTGFGYTGQIPPNAYGTNWGGWTQPGPGEPATSPNFPANTENQYQYLYT